MVVSSTAYRVWPPAAVVGCGWDDPDVEVSAADLGELSAAAIQAHRCMWERAKGMSDADCRGPSLLPGWSRGHVLTHWARNADGQSRMLLAAVRSEVAAQYPGGAEQRDSEIETGAARTAELILVDACAAIARVEEVWRRMPPDAWLRPVAARAGRRPAWMSVWARWRETEIHHVDLNAGYSHLQWSAEFVGLLLPRVMPTLAARLPGDVRVRAEVTDRPAPAPASAVGTSADLVVVRGAASAILCWLLGRPLKVADLAVTRGGQPWPLPVLQPWA